MSNNPYGTTPQGEPAQQPRWHGHRGQSPADFRDSLRCRRRALLRGGGFVIPLV